MQSELELLDRAVQELSETRTFPLVFGGLTGSSGVHIASLRGHRTPFLAGLHVAFSRGLGGRSMTERQPRITTDYKSSNVITHDYDHQVLSERVRTLLAVPIVVGDDVRGVIYGGRRDETVLGNVAVSATGHVAEQLQQAFAKRDELRRLQLLAAGSDDAAASGMQDAAQLEQMRVSYAEVRVLAASVTEPEIADKLRALEQRFAALAQLGHPTANTSVRLSPRELDVLSCVAVGLSNAEAGAELGLTVATVKSYLGSAARKLGQRSRHAVVAEARRQGLLP